MAQLMLHKNILKNYSKLPQKVQKRISEFIEKFQDNPYDPSLGLHSVKESMSDKKVCGADFPDGYRAIIIEPEKGDVFLMVYIDKHDDAYNWAKNKKFEVHKITGIFQIFDIEEVQNYSESITSEINNEYPLSILSDDELFTAGVPEPLIPSVKAVQCDEDLENLVDYLPRDCGDVLYGIASGMSLDEAIEEMTGVNRNEIAQPDNSGDFTNINSSNNYDLIFVEGEDELRKALQASLEDWRIFLHPYQSKIVNKDNDSPINIIGSAGTGKTVVLMHRAIRLAKLLEKNDEKILFTTFTTNLPVTIRQQLGKIDQNGSEKIEVANLHSLARTIAMRSGWSGTIAGDDELNAIWDMVFKKTEGSDLPFSKDELKEEYKWIIDPNGIDNEDEYLTSVRSDRPRISRKQRKDSWKIFNLFQRELKTRDLLTNEGVIHQARLSVEMGNFSMYKHVLVDEIQDFSLEALRLIRALSPIGYNGNPLTVAGDGHQRIYRKRVPLNRAGIEIRGRSFRLKINYRTTEEIRCYAQKLLDGVEIDNLDDEVVSTIGDHSLYKGPEPKIVLCDSEKTESSEIITWIDNLLENGYKSHEICIAYLKNKPKLIESIHSKGQSIYKLKDREADPGELEPGIRIGTMHRIKGLEFKAVILACAENNNPINDYMNADNLERSLLYVASSRARESLMVAVNK